jgi:hypothetical protein
VLAIMTGPASEARPPRRRAEAAFCIHQLISALGVPAAGPWLCSLVVYLTNLDGRPLDAGKVRWVLTGTPFYPVQIALALLVGVLLGRRFGHRAMLWVWVLPAVVLGVALVAFHENGQNVIWAVPVLSSSSIFSHFFGWGCQPRLRCIDQLIFTMPFYSSLAYALGGRLGRRLSGGSLLPESSPQGAGPDTARLLSNTER